MSKRIVQDRGSSNGGTEKLTRGRSRKGGQGKEVLERHLLEYKQSVARNDHRSAFLPKTITGLPSVRILKLRNPGHPSGPKIPIGKIFAIL